ncbi:hypothetical protein JTE90_017236 [Oedothorax gibbosus]|uniref:Uncharacterized protein n=1 Tax=Oedothorax gibbosus TaxID=931172 RepID=A0AAV6VFS8_9ARAC|nr:hypothetical protein JTE90_017236 [Oedothorax gibbosus]
MSIVKIKTLMVHRRLLSTSGIVAQSWKVKRLKNASAEIDPNLKFHVNVWKSKESTDLDIRKNDKELN